MIRRLLAALLALVSFAPAPARPVLVHPALWKVSDADTVIWLFGTIHLLPDGYVWEDRRVKAAIAGADGLVLEADLDKDPAAVAGLLVSMGRSPGLPPLAERVPPGKRAALAQMVARAGLPPAALDGMETWAAGLMLFGVTAADLGLKPGSGVEPQLGAAFKASGKPIEGLETAAGQLGYLDTLPEADQRAFLVSLLDDPAKSRREFGEMVAAWARGDERAISRAFDTEFDGSAALKDALLTRRNLAWSKWIEARMARPGTLLIAVGAGHLAGPGSVPALLARRGLRVERVR